MKRAQMLSEEQYTSLGCLKPDARIRLVGLHRHGALPGCPYTIETSGGHFRVPRVLVSLVKKSIHGLSNYDGPCEGAVNELLRKIAECGPKADPPDVACDDLTATIGGIVEEAANELRARVLEAAAAHPDDRAALVAEAMKVLSGAP